MTTFSEMHKLGSFQDFSFDLVAELIGNFKIRGKKIDPKSENPVTLFNRVDWLVNRVGHCLNVSGKINPATTTFKIDREDNGMVHVRFIDLDEKTLYTIDIGERINDKYVQTYIVKDADGIEVFRSEKWVGIKRWFAPSVKTNLVETSQETDDVVIAKAASPVVA